MKPKRTTFNQLLLTRSYLRKRRRSNYKKRLRNIQKENRKRIISNEKVTTNKKNRHRIEEIKIDAGLSFSLFSEPENVIQIIESLEKCKSKSRYIKHIQLDLSNIKQIDIGAISFLLAKVNEMSQNKRIRIWGIVPKDESCKKVFEESGFLDYMRDLAGRKFIKHSDNFIFRVGTDKTRNERVGKTIEKSMKFLTGNEKKYPPIYSIIQEICSNSVEWANAPDTKNKNWFLGVNFPQKNGATYITFTMTDIGFGILRTLNRRFGIFIKENLQLKQDTEILERAFERRYGSKTGESNRNRGLPLIKDRFAKGFIKDLKVITNNVFLDFAESRNTRTLSKNLPGTFYTWNIDLNCLEKWNQIEIY